MPAVEYFGVRSLDISGGDFSVRAGLGTREQARFKPRATTKAPTYFGPMLRWTPRNGCHFKPRAPPALMIDGDWLFLHHYRAGSSSRNSSQQLLFPVNQGRSIKACNLKPMTVCDRIGRTCFDTVAAENAAAVVD